MSKLLITALCKMKIRYNNNTKSPISSIFYFITQRYGRTNARALFIMSLNNYNYTIKKDQKFDDRNISVLLLHDARTLCENSF